MGDDTIRGTVVNMSVFGVAKTTLRFDDPLEGLIQLRRAVMLVFIVYHSERIQIRTSKEKRGMGLSPGEAERELPVALSLWSCTDRASVSQK